MARHLSINSYFIPRSVFACRMILSIILLSSFSTQAQVNIDSIKSAYLEAGQPEDKIIQLHQWCRSLRYQKSADSVSQLAIHLIPQIGNDSLIGRTWFTHATIIRHQSFYDSADVYYRKALSAFQKSEDPDMQISCLSRLAYSHIYRANDGLRADSIYQVALEIAQNHDVDSITLLSLYQGRGNALSIQNRFSESVEQFLNAERYLDTMNHPWYKTFYINFANVQLAMKRYDLATQMFQKVYQTSVHRADYDGIAFTSRSLGHIAVDQEKYEDAERYYLNAIDAFEKAGDEGRIFYTTSDLAQVYGKLNRLEESYRASLKTLEYSRKSGLKYEEAWSLAMIGFYHNAKGNPSKGLQTCQEAWEIIQSENNRDVYQVTCECLVESYEMLNKHAKALAFFRILQQHKDSLSVENQEREIAQVEAQFQIEKERELSNLEKENQRIAYESSILREKNIRNLMAIGLVGLGAVLFLLWRAFHTRKKANALLAQKNKQIQTALSEKELLLREIHHRVKNNLQVVSSLLSLQSSFVDDENALEAINEGRDRVQSMALIHQNLYREENLTGIEIHKYFEKLVEGLFESYNIHPDRIKLEMSIEELNLDVDTVIPLGLVVNELVSNALKYAFPENQHGLISILLKEEGETLLLSVADNGVGIKDEWKEENDSFGYQLIHAFKDKLEADLDVSNISGTSVTLRVREYQKAG